MVAPAVLPPVLFLVPKSGGGQARTKHRRQDRRRYELFPCASARGALQVVAAAGLAQEVTFVYDYFAPRKYSARVALHLIALEHGVIHAHVMSLRSDDVTG